MLLIMIARCALVSIKSFDDLKLSLHIQGELRWQGPHARFAELVYAMLWETYT